MTLALNVFQQEEVYRKVCLHLSKRPGHHLVLLPGSSECQCISCTVSLSLFEYASYLSDFLIFTFLGLIFSNHFHISEVDVYPCITESE